MLTNLFSSHNALCSPPITYIPYFTETTETMATIYDMQQICNGWNCSPIILVYQIWTKSDNIYIQSNVNEKQMNQNKRRTSLMSTYNWAVYPQSTQLVNPQWKNALKVHHFLTFHLNVWLRPQNYRHSFHRGHIILWSFVSSNNKIKN